MRIGLKFCGGCNPYYERSAEVEKLKKSYPQFLFEAVRKEEYYDIILLICGCTRSCVQYYREAKADRYVILRNQKDFGAFSLEMEKIRQEEENV